MDLQNSLIILPDALFSWKYTHVSGILLTLDKYLKTSQTEESGILSSFPAVTSAFTRIARAMPSSGPNTYSETQPYVGKADQRIIYL